MGAAAEKPQSRSVLATSRRRQKGGRAGRCERMGGFSKPAGYFPIAPQRCRQGVDLLCRHWRLATVKLVAIVNLLFRHCRFGGGQAGGKGKAQQSVGRQKNLARGVVGYGDGDRASVRAPTPRTRGASRVGGVCHRDRRAGDRGRDLARDRSAERGTGEGIVDRSRARPQV